MRKCKILFVDHSTIAGGAQIWLSTYLRYFDRKKFDPFLVIAKDSPYEHLYSQSNVPVFKIDFEPLKRFNPAVLLRLVKSVRQLNEIVKDVNPDLVVAHTTRALILTSLLPKKHKLVAYILDYDYPHWLMATLGKRVDKFLMVSRSINDYYKGRFPKCEVVYISSDLGKKITNPDSSQVFQLKKKYKIKKEDTVIGFAGRLVERKGPQILLQAIVKIKDPKVKLLIFGSGKGQEGSVEKLLEEMVKRYKLETRVKLAGFIEDRSLIFSLIDIFVLASVEKEPFASSVIEAAMAKLPIVATNNGGTPEFIKDGANGFLVDPGDSKTMAKALNKLVEDRNLARKLGQQAYDDVMDNFTIEKVTDKIFKVYENIK
ncbi:MAG: glycosyltransferase family 4 protein [Patescibacteria group bacterium]|nr:glycosyltransferase family 4 protein [Patescibacteria group bacterium]